MAGHKPWSEIKHKRNQDAMQDSLYGTGDTAIPGATSSYRMEWYDPVAPGYTPCGAPAIVGGPPLCTRPKGHKPPHEHRRTGFRGGVVESWDEPEPRNLSTTCCLPAPGGGGCTLPKGPHRVHERWVEGTLAERWSDPAYGFTRSGVPIDDAMIERVQREAEQGYEVGGGWEGVLAKLRKLATESVPPARYRQLAALTRALQQEADAVPNAREIVEQMEKAQRKQREGDIERAAMEAAKGGGTMSRRKREQEPRVCPHCGVDRFAAARLDRQRATLDWKTRQVEELAQQNGLLRHCAYEAQHEASERMSFLQRKVSRQARALRRLERKLLARGEEPYEGMPLSDTSPVTPERDG